MPALYSSGLVFIPKAKLGDFDVVLSEKKLLMMIVKGIKKSINQA